MGFHQSHSLFRMKFLFYLTVAMLRLSKKTQTMGAQRNYFLSKLCKIL